MTDEEIVEALDCMTGVQLRDCDNCPFTDGNFCDDFAIARNAIALIHRLQNENAGLKERGEIVINNLHETIDKQKAEIERLTEERDKYQEKWQTSYMNELNLQKQVDELKSENTELYKEHTALIAGSILAKQNIAKDTAKEILQEGKYCLSKSLQEWIKERFGVEADND